MTGRVQLFLSSDVGAPQLNGTVGNFVAMLDACLVNGFAPLGVTSITWAAGTATMTLAAANATLRTGTYLDLSGANEAPFNGTVRITVLSSTMVTFPLAGTPPSVATGAIVYRRSSLGWTMPFTGTNKRVYRSPNGESNQHYLRVLETAREIQARGYEVMTDIDTGQRGFPTELQRSEGVYWLKSTSADTTVRPWTVVGDDKTFYVYIGAGYGGYVPAYGFGHVNPYRAGDGYCTFLAGMGVSNWVDFNNGITGFTGLHVGCNNGATASVSGTMYMARSYNTLGNAITISAFDWRAQGGNNFSYPNANSGIVYPNGPDNSLWLSPIYCIDHTGNAFHMRGIFPGMHSSLHTVTPHSTWDYVPAVVGGVNKLMYVQGFLSNNTQYSFNPGAHYIDINGPW